MDCDRCGKHFEKDTVSTANVEPNCFILIWNRLFGGYVCKNCDRKLVGNLTDSGSV